MESLLRFLVAAALALPLAFTSSAQEQAEQPKSRWAEISEIRKALDDLKAKVQDDAKVAAAREKYLAVSKTLTEAAMAANKVLEEDPSVKAARTKMEEVEKSAQTARTEYNTARAAAMANAPYKAAAGKVDAARNDTTAAQKDLEEITNARIIEQDPKAKQLLERLRELSSRPRREPMQPEE